MFIAASFPCINYFNWRIEFCVVTDRTEISSIILMIFRFDLFSLNLNFYLSLIFSYFIFILIQCDFSHKFTNVDALFFDFEFLFLLVFFFL